MSRFSDPSVTVFSELGGLNIQQDVATDLVVNMVVTNVAVGNNNQVLQAMGSNVNFALSLSFSNSVQNTFYTSESVMLDTTAEQSALPAGKSNAAK